MPVSLLHHYSFRSNGSAHCLYTRFDPIGLQQCGRLVMMDSTHHTCYAMDDRHAKVYLVSLVVKHSHAEDVRIAEALVTATYL
ncbi:BQ5605_C009g05715 [Microbotryum silenes-dioicae]|uniref:BQ5605_C009g05715 protein n=1 Tax=Microbotryum silenes-dioicae TaxID=796604 RepID=A0A2X0P9C0_9BASI|nr:BQ5605_C009g05715 [Microbotryum silenes-dioicae]